MSVYKQFLSSLRRILCNVSKRYTVDGSDYMGGEVYSVHGGVQADGCGWRTRAVQRVNGRLCVHGQRIHLNGLGDTDFKAGMAGLSEREREGGTRDIFFVSGRRGRRMGPGRPQWV